MVIFLGNGNFGTVWAVADEESPRCNVVFFFVSDSRCRSLLDSKNFLWVANSMANSSGPGLALGFH